MSGGQADDPSELLYTLSGHFDEVCGLVAVGNRLVSVSIDCTVRRWGLTSAEMEAVERAAERDEGIEGAGGAKLVEEADVKGVALTAEEEAELADLMD